ncbi:MAG: hypothetical protein RIR51_566 [Bacteroidota bacterium]|jgi:L-lactate dehydrogenase complex protein LldG
MNKILDKIKSLPKLGLKHPGDFLGGVVYADPKKEFIHNVELAGAKVIEGKDWEKKVQEYFPGKELKRLVDIIQEGRSLEDLDLLGIEAQLGVAENGAVYLNEDSLAHRVSPFICQHLVIFLSKATILNNMHEAYETIKEESGFSLFLAGPSKTADIEQSLVIGAHGSRSTLIVISEE